MARNPTNPRDYLDKEAIAFMRHHIRSAGGNEVFFAGAANGEGVVESVQVLARGNKSMVPAIVQHLQPGDVVIHNHPSGVLEPSRADTGIASQLGNEAIGFYIVDNTVAKIYVVVEPQRQRKLQPLDVTELTKTLGPDGPVATLLENYESRPPQEAMLEKVALAFNENKVTVIEAGTGTGKTMAYLLPAIEWSRKNRERVVIATGTINLQEQLMNKDIPLLQKALGNNFRAELVKGRTNYACRRKLAEVGKQADMFSDPSQSGEMQNIIQWAAKTTDGSKADLGFIPNDQVWEKIQSESDTTLRAECEFYNECFFYNARRRAAAANLLIANHHIFFADLSVRSERGESSEVAVLPKYNRVILDEAHDLEDVASSYFGVSVTYHGVLRAITRLYRARKEKETGLLPFTMARLQQESRKVSRSLIDKFRERIEQQAQPALVALESQLQLLMEKLFVWARFKSDSQYNEIKVRLTTKLRNEQVFKEILDTHHVAFQRAMNTATEALGGMLELFEPLEHFIGSAAVSLDLDIRAQLNRLLEMAEKIEHVLLNDAAEIVYWLELKESRFGNVVRLRCVPLDIAPVMRKTVYEFFPTVVMTSATLSIAKSFRFFENRLGLSSLEAKRHTNACLESPFDFEQQALVAVPTDVPEPNHRSYFEALRHGLERVLDITQGNAFILFTSYSLLNRLYQDLAAKLQRQGMLTLKQGSEPRHVLLERFRKHPGSVLFGTDSFWQGVDVHGEALQCVIIPRLPFRVPSEPVIEARVEDIDRRGGNSFMEYSVPQAIIKFKQGIGRLIRRKSDFGTIVIFDSRIVSKFYGRMFLESLPACRVVNGPSELVYRQLSDFYRQHRGEVGELQYVWDEV